MSGLKVRFLGQSGFQLSKDDSSILIDPFDAKSGDIDGDVVYCTHGHPDHVGGITKFMVRNPVAVLVANEQVAKQFKAYSNRTVIAKNGGNYIHGAWEFRFIQLRHGILRDMNMGVIISNKGDSFGHLGDTVTYDGFYHERLDTIAIPITGGVTTSPGKAIDELKQFDKPLPNIVVMHWAFRNPGNFCKRLEKEIPGTQCYVPQKGKLLPL